MKIYGVFDVCAGRLVNVFLAQNDITAVRLNFYTGNENVALRKGFNLVSLGDVPVDTPTICRLVDCESKLNELLEKEGC